jgi:2-polyprenyl-3-methyl-5-hydroxy-6-metoxy-1,4-benzoquinol methylase
VNPFDAKAAEWDSPVHIERAAAVAAAIRAAVPLGPGARVADVGAGTGLLGRALAPDAGSVVITDPSPGMLAEADAAIARDGLSNVSTRRFELGVDMPPPSEFDLVVSLMALHHVKDTDLALQDLARMLAPGGWVAMADLDAEDGSFHVDPEERAVVLHGYDRDDLGQRARSAGFETVRFEDVWDITKNDRRYTVFLMTARLAA